MALGTQPVGKLLDYEQYIEHQLKRTRSRIKFTDVFTAALLLATIVMAVIFIEILFDHTLGLPLMVRRVVLWGGALAGSIFAIRQMFLPMVSHVNGVYAAKTIEESHPAFKNSLINYLSLRSRREDHSKAFMAAVEANAVKDLTDVEVDTVVNQRRLLQVAYALSTVVVLFCIYFALTPKSIYDSARRILLADVVRPTNTRLTNIKPGDFSELSDRKSVV